MEVKSCNKIYHFKVNNTVMFRTFSMLYSHNLYLVPKHFQPFKVNPHTQETVTLLSPLPPVSGNHQALFCLDGCIYSGFFM